MTGPVCFDEYDKSFSIFQPDGLCEAPINRPIDDFVFCDPNSQTCAKGSVVFSKSISAFDYLTFFALAPIALADLPARAAAFQQELPLFRAEELDLVRFVDANWDAMAGVASGEQSSEHSKLEDVKCRLQAIESGSLSEMRIKYRDVPAFFQHAGVFYLQAAFYFDHYRDSGEAGRYIYAAHSHFRRGFEVAASAMAQTIESGNYSAALQFAMLAREYLFEQMEGYQRYDIKNQWKTIKEDFDTVTGLFVGVRDICKDLKDARLHAIALENLGDLYAKKAEVAGFRAPAELRNYLVNEARDTAIYNYEKAADFFKALTSTTPDAGVRRQLLAAEARLHLKSSQLLIERGDYELAYLQGLNAIRIAGNYFKAGPSGRPLSHERLIEIRTQDSPFYLAIAEGETLVAEALSKMESDKTADHIEKAKTAIFNAVENRDHVNGEALFTDPDLLILADLLERVARVSNPDHAEFQATTWIDAKLGDIFSRYSDSWRIPYIVIDPRMTIVRSAAEAGTFAREHIEMVADILRSYEGVEHSIEQIIVRMAVREENMMSWLNIINIPEGTVQKMVEFARVETERIGRGDIERARAEKERRKLK